MLKNNLLFNNKIKALKRVCFQIENFDLDNRHKVKNILKKNHSTTVENSLMVPQKLNIELPYDPIIPLLDKCAKELKTGPETSTHTYMFTEVLFRIAKRLKQPKCSLTNECINKLTYLYNRILLIKGTKY